MTQIKTVTQKTPQKTPLERWLFEHELTVRDAARLFKTNRTSLANYARGVVAVPPGETRDLIARALLGELTLADLRARSATSLSPSSQEI